MKPFRVPGAEPNGRLGMSRKERRKLAALVLGLLLVLLGLRAAWNGSQSDASDPALPPEERESPRETVHVPAIDAARLDALVSDADERARVVLEREALDALLADVRQLTPSGFEALGIRALDRAEIERLRADPRPARGRAYRARGAVARLDTRRHPATGAEEHLGLLELEGGGRAWFLCLGVSELGAFLRVDGLFLKNYRAEETPVGGAWVDAPLLIARQAERSYPERGPLRTLDGLFAGVEDDVLSGDATLARAGGLSFDALWGLMAYARDLAPDGIDWQAAPELDAALFAAVQRDGSLFRGRPFRLPLCRLQGARVKRAGENPARIEAFTEGWLGHAAWPNVLHFQSPAELRGLAPGDLVSARGFFLQSFAYESAQRGPRVAPVFVLAALEQHVPREDPLLRRGLLLAAGLAVLLALGLALLVRRDGRRSRRFADELLRERRLRRERARSPAVASRTPEPGA